MNSSAVLPFAIDQHLFRAMPGNNVLLLPDAPVFTIVAVTDNFCKMLGRSLEELTGKGLFEAFPSPPGDPEQVSEKRGRVSLEQALANKEAHHLPLHRHDIINPNGTFEERYWSTTNKPVVNENGQVLYIIHSVEDMTTRIKAAQQEERLKSLEKSNHLFMQAPVTIGIVRGDNYVIEVANESLLQVWGRTIEVIGKPLFDAIPELRGQGFLELLDQVRETGETFFAFEHPIKLVRNGKEEVTYFDFIYKPYYENGETKASGVFAVGHDITKQVELRQKFKNVLEQATDPILIYKGENMVLEVANEALLKIWNRDASVIGKPLLDILPEMESQGFYQLLQQVYHTGKPHHGYEVPAVFQENKEENRTVYFNFTYQPYREADGSITGVLVLASDVTGQVLAKKQVEESQENLRNMILQSPVAMCILNGPSFVVEIANDRMFELWGKSPGQMLHKPVFEGLPEVLNQGLEELLLQVYTKGERILASERPISLPRNGKTELAYINFVYEPFTNGNGTRKGVMVIATDVTEQVLARKKVEESEHELQLRVKERTADLQLQKALVESILDSSISGVMALDAVKDVRGEVVDFTIIKINERLTDITGLDQSVIGQSYLAHFTSSAVNGIFEMYKEVLLLGKPQRIEVFSTNLNLNNWFDISAAPRGENGIVVTFDNISQQREAAMQIEQQRNLLNSILANSPSGIIVYTAIRDKENRIIDFQSILANEAAEVLTRVPNTERLQKTLLETTPLLKDSVQYQMAVHTLETGEPFRSQYYMKLTGKWLEVSVVKMHENHLINVFHDISATKETQLQLEESIKALKRKNEELEQFTYVSHHDLQEPLRKIIMFSDMVKAEAAEKLSEGSQKRLEKVTDAAQRMSAALKDVLNFASLSKEEQYTEVNLDEILAAITTDLEHVIAEKSAQISMDHLPTLRAVPQQMHQLFYNLVNNALKFSKGDQTPSIKITCHLLESSAVQEHPDLEQDKRYYAISVQDNGIGFNQDAAGKIFGMFQRLHPKQTYAGTGIGLALCKKVVLNHNGKIWAESNPGEGAAFKVLLPV